MSEVLAYTKKRGSLATPKVKLLQVSAPENDTTINAGASATITIPVGVVRAAALAGINGLPADVYISNIAYIGDSLAITLVNTGSSNVTISAGSLTVQLLVVEERFPQPQGNVTQAQLQQE